MDIYYIPSNMLSVKVMIVYLQDVIVYNIILHRKLYAHLPLTRGLELSVFLARENSVSLLAIGAIPIMRV